MARTIPHLFAGQVSETQFFDLAGHSAALCEFPHDHGIVLTSLVLLLARAGTFSSIWQLDGFRGLYRGLGPTIIGYLPTWAIYFTVYDKVKVKMASLRGKLRWPELDQLRRTRRWDTMTNNP